MNSYNVTLTLGDNSHRTKTIQAVNISIACRDVSNAIQGLGYDIFKDAKKVEITLPVWKKVTASNAVKEPCPVCGKKVKGIKSHMERNHKQERPK